MRKIKKAGETPLNFKPAVLIDGEHDPVKLLGMAYRTHHLMPNSELFLIDKERHFPHGGQSKKLSEMIYYWIIKTKKESRKSMSRLK